MKIYLKGQEIPVNETTWEDLCSPACYVDFSQDRHIEWPATVKLAMRCAPMQIQKCLGVGNFKPKSLWARIEGVFRNG